jgi:hypothetical protein
MEIHDGNDDSILDPNGFPMSPCIVMEKGGSLNELCKRAEPDQFMSIAVPTLQLLKHHSWDESIFPSVSTTPLHDLLRSECFVLRQLALAFCHMEP